MIRNILVLCLLMLLAVAYTWYADYHGRIPADETAPVAKETAATLAPDFTFQSMTGETRSLSDFKGKAIVLNFWASWCAPCVMEFPQMLKLATSHKKNTVFIFLSVDDSKADIARFLKKYGETLPQQNVVIAWDKDKSISQTLYQTFRLPETYLIDSDRMIREKIIGASIDWLSAPVQQKIDLLAD